MHTNSEALSWQVHPPLHVDKSLLFNLTCPGLLDSTASQLELRRGEASSPFRLREICREKTVRIRHHRDFEKDKKESEILESFISSCNLTALKKEYRNKGLISKVSGGEAEIMIEVSGKSRSCDHRVILSVHCTQAVNYQPYHWISRFPRSTSKLWNVRDLFTPGGWAMLFLTPCIMFGFFKLLAMKAFSQLSFVKEELPLIPTW